MNKSFLGALTLVLLLSACGTMRDSRLNPFNWFGGDRETRQAFEPSRVRADPRPIVSEITGLRIDRMPGGAILTARGLPPTQGYWAADLVPLGGVERPDAGTLRYEFRIIPPETRKAQGTQASREVVTGLFISDQKLQGVRQIEMIAAINRRSVRR